MESADLKSLVRREILVGSGNSKSLVRMGVLPMMRNAESRDKLRIRAVRCGLEFRATV
jgi:hypothetical protein